MDDLIADYLTGLNLDIRSSHYSRFIDQKVTPDVLQFIADCILNFIGGDKDKEFTRTDIFKFSYFINNVVALFNKPSPTNPTTAREYDKFIGQPLRMLSFSGILQSTDVGRGYIYKVENYNLLRYIATNSYNASNFLYHYLKKVLEDSGFYENIERYKRLCLSGKVTNNDLYELKRKYQQFIRGHTGIRGVTEMNRMFPKLLNIIASKEGIPGIRSGRITGHPFYQQDLIYNEVNFRDIGNKVKGMSRQEAQEFMKQQEAVNKYHVARAKAIISNRYRDSEVRDRWAIGEATQVHHIFPESKYPQFSAYLENLIKLTPTQHYTKAHPSNHTNAVDRGYQVVCLLAKSDSIETSLSNKEGIYEKVKFVEVINYGYKMDIDNSTSFNDIKTQLRSQQASFNLS